jgi:glycosyltransferase involved in cell wall biosynthesis
MTNKIKITHIITGLGTGGAETMLLKLLSNMGGDRFENSVVALTDAGPIGERIRELGIPLTIIGMSRKFPTPWSFLRLFRQIKIHKPDIVQTWLYHADLLGFFAARLAGVKCVAWNIRCSYMGEDYYKGISGLIIKTLAAISARPEAVVINSTAGKKLHQSLGYKPERWKLIPNGFDTGIFKASSEDRNKTRAELEIHRGSFVIGLVGRWDPVKGHETFLNAARLFCEQHSDGKFIFVGSGCVRENQELMDLIPDTVMPNLCLLGERQDIPAITAALDIAVCASIGEGFPNVLGEAMASEVLCVATDVGDCAEILGETGIVVPPKDPVAMCQSWLDLYELPAARRKDLRSLARQRISDIYAIEKVISTYQEFYTEICPR